MQMSDEKRPSLRRRRHKRYGQNGVVTVRLALSGPGLSGSLFDISIGGCLVWMDHEVPFSSTDIVEVRLQCDSLNFRVLGSLRHTGDHSRILGLEFHRLSSKDTADLSDFIDRLQAAADREILATF